VKKIRGDEPIGGCNTHMHGNNTRKLLGSYLYLKLAEQEGRTGSGVEAPVGAGRRWGKG
jgi:hypothetical protein